MNKYNLADYLPIRTVQQVTVELSTVIKRRAEAQEYLDSHSELYNTDKLDSIKTVIDDCHDWIFDASHYFSVKLWKEMFLNAVQMVVSSQEQPQPILTVDSHTLRVRQVRRTKSRHYQAREFIQGPLGDAYGKWVNVGKKTYQGIIESSLEVGGFRI